MRSEANLQLKGSPDEKYRHVTASRSQRVAKIQELVGQMRSTEQAAACLHADVLLLLYQVELQVGCSEQREAAAQKVTLKKAELETRLAQVLPISEFVFNIKSIFYRIL